jgi:AbrB family looped-hinge helix DNA binding protein
MANSYSSTLSSKGQVVVPLEIRRKYGLRAGARIAFVDNDDQVVLDINPFDEILKLRGALKGKPSAAKMLDEQRKRDRALERRRLKRLVAGR